jgi:hypothetical protein
MGVYFPHINCSDIVLMHWMWVDSLHYGVASVARLRSARASRGCRGKTVFVSLGSSVASLQRAALSGRVPVFDVASLMRPVVP